VARGEGGVPVSAVSALKRGFGVLFLECFFAGRVVGGEFVNYFLGCNHEDFLPVFYWFEFFEGRQRFFLVVGYEAEHD